MYVPLKLVYVSMRQYKALWGVFVHTLITIFKLDCASKSLYPYGDKGFSLWKNSAFYCLYRHKKSGLIFGIYVTFYWLLYISVVYNRLHS